jgi:hypothetical protein
MKKTIVIFGLIFCLLFPSLAFASTYSDLQGQGYTTVTTEAEINTALIEYADYDAWLVNRIASGGVAKYIDIYLLKKGVTPVYKYLNKTDVYNGVNYGVVFFKTSDGSPMINLYTHTAVMQSMEFQTGYDNYNNNYDVYKFTKLDGSLSVLFNASVPVYDCYTAGFETIPQCTASYAPISSLPAITGTPGTGSVELPWVADPCGITDIMGCIKNALHWAFVPSSGWLQDALTSLKTTVDLKFPIFNQVITAFTSFTTLVSNESGADWTPIQFDFHGKYGLQKVDVFNSEVVHDYAPYVKAVIGGALWIMFMFWLMRNLSKVIGTGR